MMRKAIKALFRSLALVAVVPHLLSFRIRSLVIGADRAIEGSSQSLALVPGMTGQYLRRAFFGRVLASCHHTVTIEFGTLFSKAGARLDENVYIGPRCHLGLVHLERNVLLGPAVHIPSGATTHGSDDVTAAIRDQPGKLTMVRIGEGVWIGSAAVVMADVGRDSIVGAGAVVTATLPERVIAGGVPARILKTRT